MAQQFNSMLLFVNNSKIEYQVNVILNKVSTLKKYIEDFDSGNFDKQIDQFNEYPEYDEEGKQIPFDPYRELEHLLTTDGIEDLPSKIEYFTELLNFTRTYSAIEETRSAAFKSFFGDTIKMHFATEDPEGNVVMVPEDQVSKDVLDSIKNEKEIKNGLMEIGIEHCFDNYNDWYLEMIKLVSLRRPYSEMLPLFK
jgi:hypothetical protein